MSAARNSSSSLRRALGVLDYLAEFSDDSVGVSLGEFSSGLGLPKPTLLRLLAPLRESRLVEVDPVSGRYRLGPQTARLGQIYLDRLDLRSVAGDVLRQLADVSGETVHLVVPDVPWVVYVDKVESRHVVRMVSRIGARQPMHSTAVGKAYLAFADEDTVVRVISSGLERRTPHTITTEPLLRVGLRRIREVGYAVDERENEPDIRCVGAPVFGHADEAIAAVSVSGPEYRLTTERVPDLASAVVAAAGEISARLGATRRPA